MTFEQVFLNAVVEIISKNKLFLIKIEYHNYFLKTENEILTELNFFSSRLPIKIEYEFKPVTQNEKRLFITIKPKKYVSRTNN